MIKIVLGATDDEYIALAAMPGATDTVGMKFADIEKLTDPKLATFRSKDKEEMEQWIAKQRDDYKNKNNEQ